MSKDLMPAETPVSCYLFLAADKYWITAT